MKLVANETEAMNSNANPNGLIAVFEMFPFVRSMNAPMKPVMIPMIFKSESLSDRNSFEKRSVKSG